MLSYPISLFLNDNFVFNVFSRFYIKYILNEIIESINVAEVGVVIVNVLGLLIANFRTNFFAVL